MVGRESASLLNAALFALAVVAIAFATVAVAARYDVVDSIDRHAVEYVDLVAALGAHSPESVDFQTLAAPPTVVPELGDIGLRSRSLAAHIRQEHAGDMGGDRGSRGDRGDRADKESERARSLANQLDAIESRIVQLTGGGLTLDAELRRLFGVAPTLPSSPDHADVREQLAKRLPGREPLPVRLAEYQRRFAVPRGRLHAAVTTSIAVCRDQARRHLTLPDGESIDIQYVADKPWSGYSIYKGTYRSVIQVNRTFPLSANDVLTLACHEGYPGHHVYNSLRERHLVRTLGRSEPTALLLFSPEGFRAEAVVSAAASIAFSSDERVRIFRDVLFPLLDIDAREAARYVEICNLVDRLTTSTAPVLHRYLSGELDRKSAAETLRSEALMEYPDALLAYVDMYRGYAFAYTVGRDRVLHDLNGTPDQRHRWAALRQIIQSP